MDFISRPYQKDACNAVWQEWKWRDKICLVLGTGNGKTFIAAKLIEYYVGQGKKLLFLAHRDELITQASDKIATFTGLIAGVEKANQTTHNYDHKITVGSMQSMAIEKRLHLFSPDHYDYIIVDEAHGILSESYLKIVDYFNAKILGLTATFMRGDKKSLGKFFDCIAFEYNLKEAIRDGYLSPIVAKTVPLKIDMSKVKTQLGDYRDADIAKTIEPYLDEIADAIKEHAPNRKTLIFLPLIKTSKMMTEIMIAKGFKAEHIDGKSKDRKEILQRFASGQTRVLINAMLLTEGYDEPSIDCVIMLRPTQSTKLYQQAIGRGTRVLDQSINQEGLTAEQRKEIIKNSAKPNLLVLDFLYHSAKHKLHTPASLYSETEEEAEIMGNALKKGKECSLEELMTLAANEIRNERESKLAQYIDANRTRKARTIDPLNFGLSIFDDKIVKYEPNFAWEKEVASTQQQEYLKSLGFDSAGITAGWATNILSAVQSRRQQGLATPKQLNILLRNGYVNASTFSFDQAGQTISWLAENRWGKNKRR